MTYRTTTVLARTLLPLGAAMALAACGGAEEEATYEVDAVDKSGGEFTVREADEPGVEVDVPETEMTPVPEESPTLEPVESPTPEPQ